MPTWPLLRTSKLLQQIDTSQARSTGVVRSGGLAGLFNNRPGLAERMIRRGRFAELSRLRQMIPMLIEGSYNPKRRLRR
jgi:hypothetical protein